MIGGGSSLSKKQQPTTQAGKKDTAPPGHRSTISNPYQNQQIQKPWVSNVKGSSNQKSHSRKGTSSQLEAQQAFSLNTNNGNVSNK